MPKIGDASEIIFGWNPVLKPPQLYILGKIGSTKIVQLMREEERGTGLCIYTCCILEQLVPNFKYEGEVRGIHWSFNQGLGRKSKPKSVGPRSK